VASDQDKPPSSKIPGTYKAFVKKFPALGRAHEDIAKAALFLAGGDSGFISGEALLVDGGVTHAFL